MFEYWRRWIVLSGVCLFLQRHGLSSVGGGTVRLRVDAVLVFLNPGNLTTALAHTRTVR